MTDNDLVWLQEWFAKCTNGEWEHSYGVKIETLDNPGWHVGIDLLETPMSDRNFDSVKEERSESDWIMCRVKEGKFEGFSGPSNLIQIIKIFRCWAES